MGLQMKLVEVTDEFVLLTICTQLCACRKVHTPVCVYVYSEHLHVGYLHHYWYVGYTFCNPVAWIFFYLHLCDSDDTAI